MKKVSTKQNLRGLDFPIQIHLFTSLQYMGQGGGNDVEKFLNVSLVTDQRFHSQAESVL